MFTVEHVDSATVVTTLDQEGINEDVEVILETGEVTIRQFNEDMNSYELVTMSYQQFKDLFAALTQPEGAYYAG